MKYPGRGEVLHDIIAEISKSCAGIANDKVWTSPNLYTGCIAAKAVFNRKGQIVIYKSIDFLFPG
jgi:hypothetical protein